MKKGDLVCISWVDADVEAGWIAEDDEKSQATKSHDSFGLLVCNGPKFVVLSFCHNEDANDWLSWHRIPVSWIEDMRLVEEKK